MADVQMGDLAEWVSAVAATCSTLIAFIALFISARNAKKSEELGQHIEKLQIMIDSRSISTGGGGGGGAGAPGGDGGSIHLIENITK